MQEYDETLSLTLDYVSSDRSIICLASRLGDLPDLVADKTLAQLLVVFRTKPMSSLWLGMESLVW